MIPTEATRWKDIRGSKTRETGIKTLLIGGRNTNIALAIVPSYLLRYWSYTYYRVDPISGLSIAVPLPILSSDTSHISQYLPITRYSHIAQPPLR